MTGRSAPLGGAAGVEQPLTVDARWRRPAGGCGRTPRPRGREPASHAGRSARGRHRCRGSSPTRTPPSSELERLGQHADERRGRCSRARRGPGRGGQLLEQLDSPRRRRRAGSRRPARAAADGDRESTGRPVGDVGVGEDDRSVHWTRRRGRRGRDGSYPVAIRADASHRRPAAGRDATPHLARDTSANFSRSPPRRWWPL